MNSIRKKTSARQAQSRVRALGDPALAKASAWFFKTGPGQYAEGDRFIGVRVPVLRKLARQRLAFLRSGSRD